MVRLASLPRRPSALVAALAIGLLAPLLANAAAGAALASPVNLWGPSFMERAPEPTRAEALALAGRTDLIIAKAATYAGFVEPMRAVNPRLRLLAYLNGTMADDKFGSAFPASWYVRTATGEQVRTVKYGNFMMDPREPGWIASRVAECQSLLASSGYSGCALDVLGVTPVAPPYGFVTGPPIDSQTGTIWTQADWLRATTALADSVRTAVRPALLWGNGIGNGTRYAQPGSPTAWLFGGTDGMIAEGLLRSGRAPIGDVPTYDEWKSDLDMVIDAEARGRHLAVDTKVWTEGTDQEKDRWHAFSLGTYLLGTKGAGGTVRYVFLRDEKEATTVDHPWWHLPLGQPKAPAKQRANGIWERRFDGGRVLVNPSPTAVSVRLPGSFISLSGAVVTRVVLAPYSGELLSA